MTTTDTSPVELAGGDTPVVPRRSTVSEPADVFSAFRRNWKLVAIPAVMAMLIAWILAAVQPKRYRASSVAAVAPIQSLETTDMLRSVEALDRRSVISTIAAFATTPVALKEAQGTQAGDYNINTVVLPNTNLFRIDVEGPDAKGTAAIANRVPQLLATQTTAMFHVFSVSTVSAAVVPQEAFAPRVSRAIAAGLMIGLLIGAALTYALHALRTRSMVR